MLSVPSEGRVWAFRVVSAWSVDLTNIKTEIPSLSNNEPILPWLNTVLPDFGKLNLDKYHKLVWHSVFRHLRTSNNLEGMCSEHHGAGRKNRHLLRNLQSHADTILHLAVLSTAHYLTRVRGNLDVHAHTLYLPAREEVWCSPEETRSVWGPGVPFPT